MLIRYKTLLDVIPLDVILETRLEVIPQTFFSLSDIRNLQSINRHQSNATCIIMWGRDVSSPAIWATKISAHFGDNNVAQMSRRLYGQICSHNPSALNAGAKRSDVPYGHASMLLLGEGSEATEPYNKYANFFKYIS